MIETAVVFDFHGETLLWHEPTGRSSGQIPDTSSLWDFIWENRAIVHGIAHTHPWFGIPGPSTTDLTTFAAIEKALGKRLIWPILSFDLHVNVWYNSDDDDYVVYTASENSSYFKDTHELRLRSGLTEALKKRKT